MTTLALLYLAGWAASLAVLVQCQPPRPWWANLVNAVMLLAWPATWAVAAVQVLADRLAREERR